MHFIQPAYVAFSLLYSHLFGNKAELKPVIVKPYIHTIKKEFHQFNAPLKFPPVVEHSKPDTPVTETPKTNFYSAIFPLFEKINLVNSSKLDTPKTLKVSFTWIISLLKKINQKNASIQFFPVTRLMICDKPHNEQQTEINSKQKSGPTQIPSREEAIRDLINIYKSHNKKTVKAAYLTALANFIDKYQNTLPEDLSTIDPNLPEFYAQGKQERDETAKWVEMPILTKQLQDKDVINPAKLKKIKRNKYFQGRSKSFSDLQFSNRDMSFNLLENKAQPIAEEIQRSSDPTTIQNLANQLSTSKTE